MCWIRLLLLFTLSFICQDVYGTDDMCYCKLRPSEHHDSISIRSFSAITANVRGCRRKDKPIVTNLGRNMNAADNAHNRANKCGSINVAVEMEPTVKGGTFVRKIIMKMQREGKNYMGQPSWLMHWLMVFTISSDNSVEALIRHDRIEYPGGKLPDNLYPTGPYAQVHKRILSHEGDDWYPFRQTDIPNSGLVDAGPQLIKRANGQVLINYWDTCGWKLRFAQGELDFNLKKADYQPLTESLCGPCGDNWALKEYKEYWHGGIEKLVEPFRTQCLMDVNTDTNNIPDNGGRSKSYMVPACSEEQFRTLVHDDYCGFIINAAGPFDKCIEAGRLWFSKMKALLIKCASDYCEAEAGGPDAAKATLCTSLAEVDKSCNGYDSPWKDTERFSYCKT